ncbi:MAG: helix-turn-helix domain-containing protein [Burkholderiales bacterium]|nr:helix-turn-helix domain-containing protein [Burkholderiales bacterium]
MPTATPSIAFRAPSASIWCHPSPAVALRSSLVHDADEQASQLTGWDQHYDQLSCGAFSGELLELHLPQMQLFRERVNQSVRQSCTLWSDALWLGLPDMSATAGTAGAAHIRINGRLNADHDIMLRPGDEPFELLTPPAHSIFGVVVQRQALQAAAERQGRRIDWAGLQQAHWLHAGEAARAHGQRLLQAALAHTPVGLSPASQVQHVQALQAELLDMVVGLLEHGIADPGPRQSLAKRQRVVSQARELVLARPDQAVTVPELCEQLHVSRRTLQYCFEDVLGLSPLQYLRAIRLNGVRRHLRQAALRQQSVQDVAVNWGFWHFSQFASDYRKLFGEMPSTTRKAGAP